MLLSLAQQLFGGADISGLSGLVSSRKQDYQFILKHGEAHAIARPEWEAQLVEAVAYGFPVSHQRFLDSYFLDLGEYAKTRLAIF